MNDINNDNLSLTDFFIFIKKNILIILIFTGLFTYLGFNFNQKINAEVETQEKYIVDLNFIFLENEIGYLMKHIDQIFDTSSVNVNIHHKFLSLKTDSFVERDTIAKTLPISKSESNELETKFSLLNHLAFIYQNLLSNKHIEKYFKANNIDNNNLYFFLKDRHINIRFKTNYNFTKKNQEELNSLLNDLGVFEVQNAISLKTTYHNNLLDHIISDLKQIKKVIENNYYSQLEKEVERIKFGISLADNEPNMSLFENLDKFYEVNDYNNFLLGKKFLNKRLKILEKTLLQKDDEVESINVINDYISRLEIDTTANYITKFFYESKFYKNKNLFTSNFVITEVSKDYFHISFIFFPIFGFVFSIFIAKLIRYFI
tara:strand:- start:56 stop:1174 length:1119 start_codon:yes stop_codon:yes gene_type:complete